MEGVYFVCGKLGSGKGIYAAKKIDDFVKASRKIAVNYDFDTSLNNPRYRYGVTRLPDRPTSDILHDLGTGFNENSKPGLMVLDECASWLNSREYKDKDRNQLLDWFRHARKKGWTVLFLVQDVDSLDKQLVSALAEHIVELSRLDRFKIPVFSSLFEFYHMIKKGDDTKKRSSIIPHICRASTFLGKSKLTRTHLSTEFYRPEPYFGTYDTNYCFTDQVEHVNGALLDMRALYTCLPSNYFGQLPQFNNNQKPVTVIDLIKFFVPFVAFVLFTIWLIFFRGDSQHLQPVNAVQQPYQLSAIQPEQPIQSTSNVDVDEQPAFYLSAVVISYYDNQPTFDYIVNDHAHNTLNPSTYSIQPVDECSALVTYNDETQLIYCLFN